MRHLLAALAILASPLAATTTQAQSAAELELVMALSRSMNPQSIEYNREVCGFILRAPDGSLEVSKLSWGGEASCAMTPPRDGLEVISSWHTHAAWALGYDGEVPSTTDVEGDMARGVNGWVATPGGRLWFVHGQTGNIHQVCGRDCLPSDPGFVPEEHGPVEKRYSLAELRARFFSR